MQIVTLAQWLPFPEGDKLTELRLRETQQARTLYAEGHLRQIWYRDDVPGACILWEADSEEHVRTLVATLPLVQAGLLDVTIVPLKPYAGFGPHSL